MKSATLPMPPDQIGRTSQLIAISLMLSLLFLAGIAYAIRLGDPRVQSPLEYLGLGFVALALMLRASLPAQFAQAQIRHIKANSSMEWREKLSQVYFSRVLVGNASLEAAGIFNLVAYLVARQPTNLGAALGLVAIMGMSLPSQAQFESWAEQVQREQA